MANTSGICSFFKIATNYLSFNYYDIYVKLLNIRCVKEILASKTGDSVAALQLLAVIKRVV